MTRSVSGEVITRNQTPNGVARKLPTANGIIKFHSACLVARGNIGAITKVSTDNAMKTASLGGINKLKSGTIIKVAPNPANPLINPPNDTINIGKPQFKTP